MLTKVPDFMTINRISIGKMALDFSHNFKEQFQQFHERMLTGQQPSGSKWNIESLAKYPTINYTGFGCNDMIKLFDYQLLVNTFVSKFELCKNSSAIFPFDILLMVMRSSIPY